MLLAQTSTVEAVGRFVIAFAPLLFFTLIGWTATYLVLPKGTRTREKLGSAFGLIALAGSPTLMLGSQLQVVETALFFVFSVGAFIGLSGLITRSNPVHAALCFALMLLSVCGLFLLNGAPFLAAATLIVYAGAIVVTFLFVIMLAQQEGMTTADHLSREPFLACLTSAVLFAAIGVALIKSLGPAPIDSVLANVERASRAGTLEEIESILGSPEHFSQAFDEAMPGAQPLEAKDRATRAQAKMSDALAATRKAWARQDTASVKAELARLHEAGMEVHSMRGNLQAAHGLPVSKNVGTPAGQEPAGLPAANVAGIGKAFFTDYLLAVEIAGMLLLVAAIGALAITHRRTEATS